MQWRISNKYPRKIWQTKYSPYFLLVQRRKGKGSHPVARYYWRVSISYCNYLVAYKKYEYEMSVTAAMRAAEGAILEAKICGNMVTR